MPIPSPFHERTSKLCESLFWKDWAGFHTVVSYDTCHEAEYMALRHSVAMQDMTPLYKYEIRGPDTARFLDRIMVRSASRMKVGQVHYLCWCDDAGKVIDDGTVTRLAKDHFRLSAAEPTLFWLERFRRGFDVTFEDRHESLGILSIQGPFARDMLLQVTDLVDGLGYFKARQGKLAEFDVTVSRTGYTGDLGFEVWVDEKDAVKVWDALWDAGRAYSLKANGMAALDVARVEAGYIMNGVDYYSAHQCMIESRKSSPYEIGLGWTVKPGKKRQFIGRKAILEEKAKGSAWAFSGIEIDWLDLEARFGKHGLPPELPHGVWREPHCIYDTGGLQVGYASSGSWSPLMKKNLALVTLKPGYDRPGQPLLIEWMVEFQRVLLECKVVPPPFFDPERKKA